MNNIPEVKLGVVAVSRDCFPITLSQSRRPRCAKPAGRRAWRCYEAQTTVENEQDMLKAVEEVKAAGCNALTVFWATSALRPPRPSSPSILTGPACSWPPPRATGT